jgi:isocitrate dehydrogenase (NAD+)
MVDKGARIRQAIRDTIVAHDHTTPDLGGTGSTTSFADALVAHVA